MFKKIALIALAALLAASLTACALPTPSPAHSWNATYAADDYTPSHAEIDSMVSMLNARLEEQLFSDCMVLADYQSGDITVSMPGNGENYDSMQQMFEELVSSVHLTFQDSDGNILVDGKTVKKAVAESDPNHWHPPEEENDSSQSMFIVTLEFDDEGTAALAEATARLISEQIFICLDDIVLSSPTVMSPITDGAAIITGTTREQAELLAKQINAGMLPYKLRLSEMFEWTRN